MPLSSRAGRSIKTIQTFAMAHEFNDIDGKDVKNGTNNLPTATTIKISRHIYAKRKFPCHCQALETEMG